MQLSAAMRAIADKCCLLREIVRDFFPLLEMSCAVYENNGDYAFVIFTPGWCQFLDATSFANCGCDVQEALHRDQWLCHYACWDASRRCMEAGTAIDVICTGGIHLYVVPIRAGGRSVAIKPTTLSEEVRRSGTTSSRSYEPIAGGEPGSRSFRLFRIPRPSDAATGDPRLRRDHCRTASRQLK
jgi:hypothetical protein